MDNESVTGKIRLIALGTVHGLLNKWIDMNSPVMIDQHLRDLKNARDQLEDDAAVAKGGVNVVKEDIAGLPSQIAKKNRDIDALLADPTAENKASAVTLQAEVLTLEDALQAKQAELATAEHIQESMAQALAALDHRVTELNSRLNSLKSMAASTTAKNNAAKALTAAHDLAGSDTSSAVDDLEQRIRRNSAAADERLNVALGKASHPEESALNARAKAAIEDRLAKAKQPASASA